MLAKRVFRIDLHEFVPDTPGLVDLAEMTKGGRKRGARKIRSGHEDNALPEKSYRCFVLASQQVCRSGPPDPGAWERPCSRRSRTFVQGIGGAP